MRRRLQTRTGDVTQTAAPADRKNGTAAACRRTGSLFLMTQIILWACLTGTAAAGYALWQAALLLIPAGIGVWWISRWAWSGKDSAQSSGEKKQQPEKTNRLPGLLNRFAATGNSPGNTAGSHPSAAMPGSSRPGGKLQAAKPCEKIQPEKPNRLPGLLNCLAATGNSPGNAAGSHPSAAMPGSSRPGGRLQAAQPSWEALLLIPCVVVDAVAVLHALQAILSRLMPSYPAGILRIFIPGLLLAGVLLGKRNGTAYGVSLWRWLMPLLAVWVVFHVLRDQGLDDLYPLWSWKKTAGAWMTGLGALWPAGLLFLLPECSGDLCPEGGKPPRTLLYVLMPLLLGSLCALGLTVSGAWRFSSEGAGYRLLYMGRASGSMMVSGLWSLFWLLALMTSFTTALMYGQKLLHGLFPRCKPWLSAVLVALPAVILLWLWPDELPSWLLQLLPWRLALWAAAAGWAAIRRMR